MSDETKVETSVEGERAQDGPGTDGSLQDEGRETQDEGIVAEEDLDSEDSLTFSNGVIEKIVAIAMRDVPGVVGMKGGWLNRVQDVFGAVDPRKGVTVEVTPDSSVRVNIAVLIAYGAYAPQVFEDVKKTVVKQVTGMTGLEVAGVNLRIEDVLTPEEIKARQRAQQERARSDQVVDADEVEAATPPAPQASEAE